MQLLDENAVHDWCRTRSLNVSQNRFLYYNLKERQCLVFRIHGKPRELPQQALSLLPPRESPPFAGALLWLRQGGGGGKWTESPGEKTLEGLCRGWGVQESFREKPRLRFGPEEFAELWAAFILPLLYGWEAFLVPDSGDYFAFTSHDQAVAVVTRTRVLHATMLQKLRSFKPKDDAWYFKLIAP